MIELVVTRHAEARMSQRGIKKTDLEVLLAHGIDIGRNRIMLTKRDAAKEIEILKKQITCLERLSGKVLVVSDGHLVTSYHQATPVRTSRYRTRYRTKKSKSC